ncbi:MAG TPA: HRDC domain-containing protein [Methylomirabilota bacterium]|nr:HRDC domain-containing protein [Methylomirabilota bacterium]
MTAADVPVIHWARQPADLARAVDELSAAPEIALDTEGDSLHHYPERLALVQIGLPAGAVWLVDPIALPDLAPLAPLFTDRRRPLVLHAGDNDLVHLKRRYGLTFASVFDTAIAARFLGGKALGLDVLLESYLAVTLPPSRQKDDWSMRPLDAAQLAYAAADVQHLFALKARLVDELARAGRLAWVEEECAALAAQPAPERPVDPDAYVGVKGARELPSRGLAVLRELWATREQLARAADRPPFKVVGEDTLLKIAQTLPRDAAMLGTITGVTPRVLGRWGTALLAAVERGLALAEEELPTLPRRPRPVIPGAMSRRIDKLRRWRSGATERVGLEPGVLLPNRLITAIAAAAPRTLDELAGVDGVRRWRVDTFGAEMLAALTAA